MQWPRPPPRAGLRARDRTYNYGLPLMENNTVLVLANPMEPTLALLEELPPKTSLAVGNAVEAFARSAAEATVIFSWSIAGELLEQVFAMTPRLRWIHSRSAGLDGVL